MRRQLLFLIALSGFLEAVPRPALADERRAPDPSLDATSSPEDEVVAAPLTSQAEREKARQLYWVGSDHADGGQWDQAFDAYSEAFALYRAPSILYNMGYCQSRLGKLVEAWHLISEALTLSDGGSDAPLSAERRQVAESERDRLRQRLATLRVDGPLDLSVEGGRLLLVPQEPVTYWFEQQSSQDPGPIERVDGAARKTDWASIPHGSRVLFTPGSYGVRQRTGDRIIASHLELHEGLTTVLPTMSLGARDPSPTVGLVPAEATQPRNPHQVAKATETPASAGEADARPFRTVGIAGLAFGGTSFLVALVSSGFALGAEAQLKAGCRSDGQCPGALASTVSEYETAATIANVSLVAGISGSVLGAGALFLDSQTRDSRISFAAGPSSVRFRLRF